jgi:hypothetical protein
LRDHQPTTTELCLCVCVCVCVCVCSQEACAQNVAFADARVKEWMVRHLHTLHAYTHMACLYTHTCTHAGQLHACVRARYVCHRAVVVR